MRAALKILSWNVGFGQTNRQFTKSQGALSMSVEVPTKKITKAI
jgi:hypothetical protein